MIFLLLEPYECRGRDLNLRFKSYLLLDQLRAKCEDETIPQMTGVRIEDDDVFPRPITRIGEWLEGDDFQVDSRKFDSVPNVSGVL
jgi:hypothetical protein